MNGRSVLLFAMPRSTGPTTPAYSASSATVNPTLARSQCAPGASRHVTAAPASTATDAPNTSSRCSRSATSAACRPCRSLGSRNEPAIDSIGRPSVMIRISTPATASRAALSDNAQPASLRGPSPSGPGPMTRPSSSAPAGYAGRMYTERFEAGIE